MKLCFHKGVCKHFEADKLANEKGECVAVNVCQSYVGMDFLELKKSRGGGTEDKPKQHYKKRVRASGDFSKEVNEYNITLAQFLKARKKISKVQRKGKLDDNQKLALKALKGHPFKVLTAAQKEQIINIAKDL